mgnify:CR=1 FL=1
MIMILIIILFSTLLASFYNVCIHRILTNESIVFPSSYCPNCRHPLKILDLMPILSYIFLLGRCRYCKSKISPRYLIVELITPILALLLYSKYAFTWQFISYFILVSILIIVSFTDIEQQIIPNIMILIGFIFGLTFSLTGVTIKFIDAILGFIVGSGSLLIITLISLLVLGKEGMGGGDIKLLGTIGLFMGWKMTLLTFLFSLYIGGIFSILLLLLKIKKRGDYIPFGPFISLATLITLLWGKDIASWYIISFL